MMCEIDWGLFDRKYQAAEGYHHRARQFVTEGQRPSVVFNLASVALECYLIALCELNGTMPMNHNYACLMDAVEEIMDFPQQLNNEIRSLDTIFGICSVDNYHHGTPQPEDADRVLKMCSGVQQFFDAGDIAAKRSVAGNK